ncbi:MAG: diaminopimelate decarboxylase [Pyrinomonadaceae bacterium]|nr:diaminopimelate decarboxylase [Phycisphaerales bacterium]
MDHFNYRDGRLFCEDVDLTNLASIVGTPTYVYSKATFTMHYDRVVEAFAELNPLVCYSVKSCSNIHLLKLLAGRGCGMDVVSGGELYRTRFVGVPGSRVLYAGVGKTEQEIREALGAPAAHASHGHAAEKTNTSLDTYRRDGFGAPDHDPIGMFNIESEAEFHTIAGITRSMNVHARAALRVNPDVDAHTHAYTTTGKAENKFGVDLRRAKEFFRHFGSHSHLKLTGLHIHLGSPINSTTPYIEGITKVLGLIDELASLGHHIDTIDLGGGFAADYQSGVSLSAADYAAAIVPLLRERARKGLKFIIEPGRAISANAGVLLSRVEYVKQSGIKKFIICDAGMHTLIRPALYGAFHFIWPASVADQHEPPRRAEKLDLPGLETADIVGPICESSDFFAKDRLLPPVARGDVMAVFGAGAYGMTMASRYNSHPLPAEVLIDGSNAKVIASREDYQDLIARELDTHDLET